MDETRLTEGQDGQAAARRLAVLLAEHLGHRLERGPCRDLLASATSAHPFSDAERAVFDKAATEVVMAAAMRVTAAHGTTEEAWAVLRPTAEAVMTRAGVPDAGRYLTATEALTAVERRYVPIATLMSKHLRVMKGKGDPWAFAGAMADAIRIPYAQVAVEAAVRARPSLAPALRSCTAASGTLESVAPLFTRDEEVVLVG